MRALEMLHGKETVTGHVAIRYSGNQDGGSDVDEVFISQGREMLLLLATGWNLTSFADVETHASQIRRAFTPALSTRAAVNEWLGRRSGHFPLVGLHVRRTDYRLWEGGRYFWTDEQYLDLVESVLESGPHEFVLTTDEPASVGRALSEHPAVTVSPLSAPEDLYLLSRCDLIVGPPSTFSTWASFYGDVPLLHPEDPSSGLSPSEFRVMAPQFVRMGKPMVPLHLPPG